jgi:hypothetical protein
MKSISNPIALAAVVLALAATGASAQTTNNPGNSGGLPGSQIAMPEYPAGFSDPALSPGRRVPAAVASTLPADENPGVAGATGMSIVPGDRSTIAGDRRATIEQKTGGAGADNGGA